MRHWEEGEKCWCGFPDTISHLLKVDLCSQAESLREKNKFYLFMWFYIRNTPSVLRSWRSLVCILLRVELVRLFRLKFKTGLRVLSRGLHLRWSVLTFLQPSLLVWEARGAGRIWMQFPTQRAVLAHPGIHFTQSTTPSVIIIREG